MFFWGGGTKPNKFLKSCCFSFFFCVQLTYFIKLEQATALDVAALVDRCVKGTQLAVVEVGNQRKLYSYILNDF